MALVLTDSGEKLEITATIVIPFTVHYADYVGATPVFTPGVTAGDTLNGTKDLLVAPGSGQRVVRTISVHNDSGGADTITIQLDDGGVNYTIITVALPDGYTLCYDEDGWHVLDSDGAIGTTLFTHAILGPHHSDAATDTVSRGSLIYGNATPAWDELVHPGATYHLQTDANDVIWSQDLLMADDHFVGITGDVRIEFDQTDGDIMFHLGDAAGADEVQIVDSGGGVVAYVNSDGGAEFEGNVAIGDNAALHHPGDIALYVGEEFTDIVGTVYGIQNITYFNPTANFATTVYALRFLTVVTAAHAQTGGIIYGAAGIVAVADGVAATSLYMIGMMTYVDINDASATIAVGLDIMTPTVDTGSCTTGYGIRINQGTVNQPGGGSIATLYGLHINAIDEGTTNYAIYSLGGDWYMADNLKVGDGSYIGIGAAAERIIFDAAGDISFMGCNVGIGTTVPGAKLQVGATAFTEGADTGLFSGTRGVYVAAAGLYTGQLSVYDTTSMASGVGGAINFIGNFTGTTPTWFGSIAGIKENGTDANYAGALVFNTRVHGGAATEKVRITSTGKVGIGITAPLAQLHVDQPSTSGAIPVLLLDQADLSEEFIELTTTVGAGNPLNTAAIGSYYGKMRVNVTGVGYKYIALYNS